MSSFIHTIQQYKHKTIEEQEFIIHPFHFTPSHSKLIRHCSSLGSPRQHMFLREVGVGGSGATTVGKCPVSGGSTPAECPPCSLSQGRSTRRRSRRVWGPIPWRISPTEGRNKLIAKMYKIVKKIEKKYEKIL
jgi:hypothetical protein